MRDRRLRTIINRAAEFWTLGESVDAGSPPSTELQQSFSGHYERDITS